MRKYTLLAKLLFIQILTIVLVFSFLYSVFYFISKTNISNNLLKQIGKIQPYISFKQKEWRKLKYFGLNKALNESLSAYKKKFSLKELKVIKRDKISKPLKPSEFIVPETYDGTVDLVIYGKLDQTKISDLHALNNVTACFLLMLAFLLIIIFLYSYQYIKNKIYNPISHLNESFKNLKLINELKIDNIKATGEIKKFIQNIKEMYEQSKTNAKLAAIGKSTSLLAHDVRKPFSQIKSVLNILDTLKNNPEMLKKATDSIDDATRNVEGMLADIMDFSRDVKIKTRAESLIEILDFSVRQSVQGFDNFDISFIYDIKHSKKPFVDIQTISRVFINIISNGIEAIFSEKNKLKGYIKISTKNIIKEENNFIEINIENDGPIIKSENLHDIFEPFFTKGKKHGTGLGLASTKKIINLHLGYISACNKPDKQGVIFTILLPSSDVEDTQDKLKLPIHLNDIFLRPKKELKTEIDNVIDQVTQDETKFNILLLEDEALYRAAVKELINSYEKLKKYITIFDVHNYEAALSLITQPQLKISYAIVDIDLGEKKNGFDFMHFVQQNNIPLKILVHSNRCIQEDIDLGKKLGAQNFVSKPLTVENLLFFLSNK